MLACFSACMPAGVCACVRPREERERERERGER